MAKHERPMPYPQNGSENSKTGYFLTGKLYDRLKFTAQILLPAVATLYFALAGIWDLPSATQVIGSITSVDTFLGVLLGLSSASYNSSKEKFDGSYVVEAKPDGMRVYSLELSPGVEDELERKDTLTFQLVHK